MPSRVRAPVTRARHRQRLARDPRPCHSDAGRSAQGPQTMLTLRLIEDRLPAGADAVYLPAAERALYVLDGDVTVETGTGSLHQAAGSAWLGDAALGLVAGSAGAQVLRWELARADDPDTGVLRAAPHCTSTAKLAARVDPDPAFGWLMRCDR